MEWNGMHEFQMKISVIDIHLKCVGNILVNILNTTLYDIIYSEKYAPALLFILGCTFITITHALYR